MAGTDLKLKRAQGDTNLEGKHPEGKLDAHTFYKLLMTTSNLHSTIESFYNLIGEDGQSQYHKALSQRFFTEANRLRSVKLDKGGDNKKGA